ncbi:RHS repeat-associated core domain-containing protein [Streptomyces sp. NPDC059568]|uniref:RHS repeat-associated core domain-containing protein n=1 Tax=Streptomyces sp. NPDC059568 TaxID=3346868 RepID=UPI00368F0513
MEFVYAASTSATVTAFGNYAGQVTQIKQWATSPGASSAAATVVAQYAYDDSGRLCEEWDPRISPPLKTKYTYDTDGRITALTPPGELPWTFTYGTTESSPTADKGMLLSGSRPNLVQGSKNQQDGTTATTSVVYDVPLTGPNAMDAKSVGNWGQADLPTDATAIFPAPAAPDDFVPTSHTGSSLAADDYKRATINYTDSSGYEVNTAAPDGHITTSEFDQFGNAIRELTARNRELALATGGAQLAELTELGIDGLATNDRAEQLSTRSVYSSDGLRETEVFGPTHQVTLASLLQADTGGSDQPAGTTLPTRSHTLNTYDEGRPTDGTASASNQITTVKTGAYVDGYPADGDIRITKTGYDWDKGLVNRTSTASGLTLTSTTSGSATSRVYSRDSDSTIVASDTAEFSIQGQTVTDTNTNGQTRSRSYGYDLVGRLARADETTPDGSCSRRDYSFDNNSNRTELTTSTSSAGESCTSAEATTTSYTYDSADRLTTPGTLYDAFGRTTTEATGTTISYHADDVVRQQIAGISRQTWTLDAVGRAASWTTEVQGSGGTWTLIGTKKNHYGGDGDSPVWTEEDSNGTITRDVRGMGSGLEAITNATGGAVLQFTDLHGDVTVQLPLDDTRAPVALAYDEYGSLATGSAGTRYGWLGAVQRASDSAAGLSTMGIRLYDPAIGRFLSVDPEEDGGANAYVYCSADPVNCADPTGLFDYVITYNIGWSKVSASRFFTFVKANFGTVFPIAGHPNKLPGVGTRINLHVGAASFPVRVTAMNSHYWKFSTLKGHPDHPGYISFDFKRKKNGDMLLIVHGHSRFSLMDFIVGGANYEKVATETWAKFWRKLQTLSSQINHYY